MLVEEYLVFYKELIDKKIDDLKKEYENIRLRIQAIYDVFIDIVGNDTEIHINTLEHQLEAIIEFDDRKVFIDNLKTKSHGYILGDNEDEPCIFMLKGHSVRLLINENKVFLSVNY